MQWMTIATAGATMLAMTSGSAYAQHKIGGDGPASNMRYNMDVPNMYQVPGKVTINFDQVKVILPREDIGRIYNLPGFLIGAYNTTKEPLCFAFHFEPSSWDMHYWGIDEVHYLAPHQRIGHFAGAFAEQDSRIGVRLVQQRVRIWNPIAKRQCGAIPA
jgi:hypothetical protein